MWNKYAIKRLQQCQFSENICTDHSVWLILLFYTILWKFIKSKVSLPIGDYCFAWTHVCLWLEEFYTMPFCHVMFLLFPFFLRFNDSCQWHTKMMVGGLKIWWNLDFIIAGYLLLYFWKKVDHQGQICLLRSWQIFLMTDMNQHIVLLWRSHVAVLRIWSLSVQHNTIVIIVNVCIHLQLDTALTWQCSNLHENKRTLFF